METKTQTFRRWINLRRFSQIFFFALFVFLFLQAEYVGREILYWPVDLFFRFDPLVLTAHLLNFSPLVAGLWWSLLFVALTLVLGRFFCGWVCPMGTALDGCRRLLFKPREDRGVAARWRRGKYYLLIALLAAAPFSMNLVGLFDPLSLLYRSLAIVFYPAFGYGVEKAGLTLYRLGEPFTYVSEPVYQALKSSVLPFKPLVYLLPFLTLVLFALVVAAERVDRRFWCRALCPLGALYGLVARFSLLRRRPTALCPDCGDCAQICKMTAFAPGKPARHLNSECQLCLSCLDRCREGDRVVFTTRSKAPRAPLDLGRRQVITSLAAGVAAVPLLRLGSLAKRPDEYLVRPPGAQDEAAFLSRCIRCGECMKVCLTNGLQPVLWEAGLEGLYTPRLIPRMGYCAHSCNLCGQVCPTGAIPHLPLAKKQKEILGTAFIDRSRCIPYTEGADCLVCEEHCPVSPKAITFIEQEVFNLQGEKVKVKLPVVSQERCTGCGHCENVCPVGGAAAIRVKRSLRVEM
ncbi:MAG: 4Fe-4S binding protein [Deltaproteobacteria bacterium]|nr:MAG: 4Fe-4S binding protein [Deltaproteobacteria bacterium]